MTVTQENRFEKPWIESVVSTGSGIVPVVGTTLSREDIIDGWKTRWNIGRANYKLAFDKTRKELEGASEPAWAAPTILAAANYFSSISWKNSIARLSPICWSPNIKRFLRSKSRSLR